MKVLDLSSWVDVNQVPVWDSGKPAILSPAPTEILCPIQGYGQINGLVDDELPGHRDRTPMARQGC